MKHTKSYKKDYPRPSLVRDTYILLNGVWDFTFDEKDIGIDEKWFNGFTKSYNIHVPFTYNTHASGIGILDKYDILWYQKTFEKKNNLNHMLHIEGSDDFTQIWVNGVYIGEHLGGYQRITFDISHALKDGKNLIVIRVQDDFKTYKPRGKQRWKNENFGCWYHETTGIWKTVWLEYVHPMHIENFYVISNFSEQSIMINYELSKAYNDAKCHILIEYNDVVIQDVNQKITQQKATIGLPLITEEDQFKLVTWNDKHPNLYDITIEIIENNKIIDRVQGYFGVRDIQTVHKGIYINEEEIYLKMILDQGYFKDSGMTPKSEEDIFNDVMLIKKMGFNGVRKHQKIEDDRFYYYCDIVGLYVWLEMPSGYEFNQTYQTRFTEEWINILKNHLSFPSIITYVLFNESWGVGQISRNKEQQNFSIAMYYLTKSIDPSRLVISNDGWEHTMSDIITIHNYAPEKKDLIDIYSNIDKILNNEYVKNSHTRLLFADGFSYKQQPIIFSEYGGVALEGSSGWGYGDKVKDEKAFEKRIIGLTEAIKQQAYFSGYCLTQFTDVEQEINGLLNINRESKCDINVIKEMNSK